MLLWLIEMKYQHWSRGLKCINVLTDDYSGDNPQGSAASMFRSTPTDSGETLWCSQTGGTSLSTVPCCRTEAACWWHVGKTTQPAAGTTLHMVFCHCFHKGLTTVKCKSLFDCIPTSCLVAMGHRATSCTILSWLSATNYSNKGDKLD